jgi:O-succinylbenzoate synthase
MIVDYLEEQARDNPDRTFFLHRGRSFTFSDTHAASRSMAARLTARGAIVGASVALDLPNSPELVFLLFGGAMSGASFFMLNHRLTAAKKTELLDGFDVALTIDEATLADLTGAGSTSGRPEVSPHHEPDRPFIRMFTSGSTGLPKAAELSQRNLIEAARSSASYFLKPGEGRWQLVLPMYHVGGLQVMLRALVNGSSFILHDRYEREAVLRDLDSAHATHISVVDTILQDLLAADPGLLTRYQAIHLGGGPPNARTLEACRNLNLYVSYGMTEACATVAARPVRAFLAGPGAGGMEPLPGYRVSIAEPDDEGIGEIRISGSAVFGGYAYREGGNGDGTSATFDDDGSFRTGDRGRMEDGLLYVKERLSDLFISGGENVYPREVERALEAVPGVRAAAVIGVPDSRWGRRPVAFVTGEDLDPGSIDEALAGTLTRFQRPDQVFVLPELPHTGVGKLDKRALATRWANRIQIEKVTLYRILQPLVTPFRTSQTELTERESVIVEITDHAGRHGYSEGVAFSTPWYLPETVESTIASLTLDLIPTVLSRTYLHPAEVFPSFSTLSGNLMAKGALEPACWDLYGRIVDRPLPDLLADWLHEHGVSAALKTNSPAGVSLGIMPIDVTLERVACFVAQGYRRVKLKIQPGNDIERVSAVRDAYPDLMLTVDANRAYRADDAELFRQLDAFDLACIEEPIEAPIAEISAFQRLIRTPVSLDESIVTEDDLRAALEHPEIRNINLKIGKFGGVLPSLELYRTAAQRGIELWLGGMYETGVSKYLHAEFERLARFSIPGDISATRRYFERDIVIPEVTVENGSVVLTNEPGLGFELDRARIEDLLIEKIEVARDGR